MDSKKVVGVGNIYANEALYLWLAFILTVKQVGSLKHV